MFTALLTLISVGMLMTVPMMSKGAVGEKYDLTLWYTPTHYMDTEIYIAELIKSQLEGTGCFKVTLKSAEWATYTSQFGKMNLFLLGWWSDYPDESNFISPFVGTSGGKSIGTNYSSTEMDGYITTMTTDIAGRTKAIHDAQKLMAVDVPCIPLFSQLSQFIAYQKDVTGVNLEPSANVHYNSTLETGDTTIIIGTSDSIRNIDPSDSYEYFGSNTILQLTHGLMELPLDSFDAKPGPIIEYYNASNDGLVYNFTLKSGIQFSDGTDFNATAMKWNLDRVMAINGDPAFLIGDVINKTEVISETLLKITLKVPDATFLQRIVYQCAWPMSPASLPAAPNVNESTSAHIAGNPTQPGEGLGPYRVKSWTKDVELVLERNPFYFGTPAVNTEVIIKFYASGSALLTALEAGDIDIAHRAFGVEEREDITKNANLEHKTMATDGIRYLLFNVQMETDVNIRRAVASAIDRGLITSVVFKDFCDPILSMVPPTYSGHLPVFEDGPNLDNVVGNMTLAGYCVPPAATVIKTGTKIATVGETTTITVSVPGFVLLSTLATIISLSTLLTLKKKKKI